MGGFPPVTLEDGTRRPMHWSVFIFRDDGSAVAVWPWGGSKRRTPLRFRRSRNGGLIPVERGRHRAAAIAEVGYLLDAWGVPVAVREPGGPIPGSLGLPADEVVALVGALRPKAGSIAAACVEVANQPRYTYTPDWIRRTYYAGRERQPTAPEPFMDGPRGPELAAWIWTRQTDTGVAHLSAATEMAERLGWTHEQLCRQLYGTWNWDPSLTHTWARTPGDWAPMDENDSRSATVIMAGLKTAAILDRLGVVSHPGGAWRPPLRVALEGGRLVCERVATSRLLPELASEAGPESLRGPLLNERICERAQERGLTYEQASAGVAAEMGWSPEHLNERLQGTWSRTPWGWEKAQDSQS